MLSRDRNKVLKYISWLIHSVGLVSLIAGGIAYEYVVSALIDHEITAIAVESAEKEQFLTQADAIRQEHKQLSDRIAQLETNAVTMRQRIPEQPREAEFLKQVTQAADEEGLKIHRYERGALDRKQTHSQFTVRLSCEGDFRAIAGFLDRLSQLSRVATVQTMTLTSSGAEVYPFELSLMLYYGAQLSQGGT